MSNEEMMAIDLLKDIEEDIRVVGLDYVNEGWPDLYETYTQVKRFLDSYREE